MTVKTAAEYRTAAATARRRSQESWERSDTDGFMSQWALDSMARVYDENAAIVEAGGMEVFAVVEIATGQIIATGDDERRGDYGCYYLITDDVAAARVGRFLTLSSAQKDATRERNNAKKGVREEMVWAPLDQLTEGRDGRIYVANKSALKG